MRPHTEMFIGSTVAELDSVFVSLIPPMAKTLGISEEELRSRVQLQLAMRTDVDAEVKGGTTTIPIGLVMFVSHVTAMLLSSLAEDFGGNEKHRSNGIQLGRQYMREFWHGDCRMTNDLQLTGARIFSECLPDRLTPFVFSAAHHCLRYVVAHEFGHIVLGFAKHDSLRQLAALFVDRLSEQDLVSHFANCSRTSMDLIRAGWCEELFADVTAIDLCTEQESKERPIGIVLLSPQELEALPDQLKRSYCSAYSVRIAADLTFLAFHILDVVRARALGQWQWFRTHPPSVCRLVFTRCVFRAPEIRLAAEGCGAMINMSHAVLGLNHLQSTHAAALSLFTNDTRSQGMFHGLGNYIRNVFSPDPIENESTLCNIVTSGDQLFAGDRVLVFCNVLAETADDIIRVLEDV